MTLFQAQEAIRNEDKSNETFFFTEVKNKNKM